VVPESEFTLGRERKVAQNTNRRREGVWLSEEGRASRGEGGNDEGVYMPTNQE
jgi:hypothetical protein